jgi:hypothetical protein
MFALNASADSFLDVGEYRHMGGVTFVVTT